MKSLSFLNKPAFLIPTAALGLLFGIACGAGAFMTPVAYPQATSYYLAQIVPQDYLNLFFVLPLFTVSAILMKKGSRAAFLFWLGTLLFISYISFTYCFTIHANHLFLVYIAMLGLSVHLIIGVLIRLGSEDMPWFDRVKTKPMILFLFITGGFFISYWLVTAVPVSITGVLNESEVRCGFTTSPFHVFDLAIYFPIFIISACLLIKKNRHGYVLSAAMTVYTWIMATSLFIEMIFIYLWGEGLEIELLSMFGVLSVVSAIIALRYFKGIRIMQRADSAE